MASQAGDVDAYVAGLESQLAELKSIIYGTTATPVSQSYNAANSKELAEKDKEIANLKAENKKLQYRILTLVRTVGEKRDIINQLERK